MNSWHFIIERGGKLAALSVGLTFALGIAPLAQAEGGYVGVGFGQSSADVTCDLDITCSADDSDTGFKFFGGYQVNPNFAVEFGYYDFGEAKITGTDSVLGSTVATTEASGFNFAVVGFLPLNEKVTLLGKAGFFRWDLDANVNSTAGSASASETGFDPMFGIGGAFNITDQFSVRAEFEKFLDLGDEATTGTSDVDLISVSAVYRF